MSDGVTIFFDYDIKSLKGNPFHVETPFGLPQTCGLGDVFHERDELESLVADLIETTDRAIDLIRKGQLEPAMRELQEMGMIARQQVP